MLVLFLILGGMLSVFHLFIIFIENYVCYRLILHGLYYVEVGSSYAHFLKSFNHKWVLNFVKGFICIYWDDHMIFIFQFVDKVYHIDWFTYIEKSCIPEISPSWSWCMSFLMCCWILFVKILLRILHLWSSVILACSFLFCVVFVWFSYQGDGDLIEWIWKCSFLCDFLKES